MVHYHHCTPGPEPRISPAPSQQSCALLKCIVIRVASDSFVSVPTGTLAPSPFLQASSLPRIYFNNRDNPIVISFSSALSSAIADMTCPPAVEGVQPEPAFGQSSFCMPDISPCNSFPLEAIRTRRTRLRSNSLVTYRLRLQHDRVHLIHYSYSRRTPLVDRSLWLF